MRETGKVHFVFTKRIVQQSRNVLSFLFIERHCQRRVNVRFIASNSVPPSSLFLPKLWKIADGYIFINFIFSENLESYIYKKKKKKKKKKKNAVYFPLFLHLSKDSDESRKLLNSKTFDDDSRFIKFIIWLLPPCPFFPKLWKTWKLIFTQKKKSSIRAESWEFSYIKEERRKEERETG